MEKGSENEIKLLAVENVQRNFGWFFVTLVENDLHFTRQEVQV